MVSERRQGGRLVGFSSAASRFLDPLGTVLKKHPKHHRMVSCVSLVRIAGGAADVRVVPSSLYPCPYKCPDVVGAASPLLSLQLEAARRRLHWPPGIEFSRFSTVPSRVCKFPLSWFRFVQLVRFCPVLVLPSVRTGSLRSRFVQLRSF